MATLSVRHVDEAVSSMTELERALNIDLEQVNLNISNLEDSPTNDIEEQEEMHGLHIARASILSALQSINEVLQWVNMKQAVDSEGNELKLPRKLPEFQVRGFN